MKKKLFAALLALVMVLSLLPVTALADGPSLPQVIDFFKNNLGVSPLEDAAEADGDQDAANRLWVGTYGVSVTAPEGATSVKTLADEGTASGEVGDAKALVYKVDFTAQNIRYRGKGEHEIDVEEPGSQGEADDFGFWAGLSFPVKYEDITGSNVKFFAVLDKGFDDLAISGKDTASTNLTPQDWTAGAEATAYDVTLDWGKYTTRNKLTIVLKLGSGLAYGAEADKIDYIVYQIDLANVSLQTTPGFIRDKLQNVVPADYAGDSHIGVAETHVAEKYEAELLASNTINVTARNLQYQEITMGDGEDAEAKKGFWVGVNVPVPVGYTIKTIDGVDVSEVAAAAVEDDPATPSTGAQMAAKNITGDTENGFVKYFNGTGLQSFTVGYEIDKADDKGYPAGVTAVKTVKFDVNIDATTADGALAVTEAGVATVTANTGAIKAKAGSTMDYESKVTSATYPLTSATITVSGDDLAALKKGDGATATYKSYTLNVDGVGKIKLSSDDVKAIITTESAVNLVANLAKVTNDATLRGTTLVGAGVEEDDLVYSAYVQYKTSDDYADLVKPATLSLSTAGKSGTPTVYQVIDDAENPSHYALKALSTSSSGGYAVADAEDLTKATSQDGISYFVVRFGESAGGGGDSGSTTTTPTTPEPSTPPTEPEPTTPPAEPVIPEKEVAVEEVAATVDETTGKATAEVTEEAMDKAVEDAIAAVAEAEAAEEEVAPVVTIPVKTAEGAKNVDVKLPAKSVEKLAETKNAALEVKSDVGEVKLDNTALKALAETIDETSTITLEIESEVAEDELTAEQIAAIEELEATILDPEEKDAELIDVTLYVNDQPKGDFGGGEIEVTVPAPKNVTAQNVRVYYLNDQGKLERMSGVRVVDGKVKFKTTHLSKYIITSKALTAELPFTDVPEDAWYMKELAWAYEKGIAKGMDDAGTLFVPGNGCTRAQFVTFLWRACGEQKVEAEVKFTDVDPAQYGWAMDAIKWAVANKIIFGTDDAETIFEPETVCSRAQAMTMMYRANGQPDAGEFGKFTDVPEGEYYTNAVAWAVAMHITEGATDTTFEPDSPCIRAQMVAFLYRMFNGTGVG